MPLPADGTASALASVMPYEHEPVKQTPPPPAWTQHPVVSDAAWLVLSLLMLVTVVRNDGPLWVIALLAVLLSARAIVAVRQEVLRRKRNATARTLRGG